MKDRTEQIQEFEKWMEQRCAESIICGVKPWKLPRQPELDGRCWILFAPRDYNFWEVPDAKLHHTYVAILPCEGDQEESFDFMDHCKQLFIMGLFALRDILTHDNLVHNLRLVDPEFSGTGKVPA
jgi:hypothetical protein